MLSILWMLFVAWFLQIFGFSNIVIEGLSQLFHIEIGMTGYYFIFAAAGLIKNVLHAIHSGETTIKELNNLNDKLDN